MPDSIAVFTPLWRCEDANGAAVSGAKLKFYDSGTTTPKTVYSDSGLTVALGTTVTCDSGGAPANGGGTKTQVYTGIAAYKVVITTADDVALATYDAVKGALDTSGFSGGGDGTSLRHVVPKTADFTVSAPAEQGYVYNCDVTGATITATLVSSVTATDGFPITIRHDGSANQVKIATLLGQYIKLPGGSSTSGYTLTGRGHSVDVVADGGGWVIVQETPPLIAGNSAYMQVEARLSTPPASPTGGARYILTGTPTADWLTYAANDVAEADGQGGWIKHTPGADCGWLAYVKGEDMLVQYRGSAWVDLPNITAPAPTSLALAVFAHQLADGTVGGTATTAAWTRRTINTTLSNTITGCSLATNVITLPTGTYLVHAAAYQQRTNAAGLRILQGASTVHWGLPSNTATDGAHLSVYALITVSGATDTIELQYYAQSSSTTSDLGVVLPIAGNLETYALVSILALSSVQGPQGAQGPQGTLNGGLTLATVLANGVNSNVAITSGAVSYGKIRVTGPTGAFSISGFAAPTTDNYRLTVYNTTSQTMTLTNDATSTAANRILTMTGADVALTGPSMIELTYDSTSARWIYHNG